MLQLCYIICFLKLINDLNFFSFLDEYPVDHRNVKLKAIKERCVFI